jgi:large conductance mechanosensitive channel
MKKFFDEFKKFALKGNVIDLAVGVIIGGAFGKIVSSLVNDILMPFIGLLMGRVDLTNLSIKVVGKTATTPGTYIKIGMFLQTVVDFVLVAFVIFIVIKIMNRFKKKEEEKPVQPEELTKQEMLLTEIRDLLNK